MSLPSNAAVATYCRWRNLRPVRNGAQRSTTFRRFSSVTARTGVWRWRTYEPRRAFTISDGVPTAVVSLPCWELFEQQDEAYRREVVGRGTVRVAVEAAVQQGWERWIGEDGGFVGMRSFGASGPEQELFEHFGITPERVAAEVRSRL
jgi:hypothetical protein